MRRLVRLMKSLGQCYAVLMLRTLALAACLVVLATGGLVQAQSLSEQLALSRSRWQDCQDASFALQRRYLSDRYTAAEAALEACVAEEEEMTALLIRSRRVNPVEGMALVRAEARSRLLSTP